jgi:hypothetical protein
VYTYNPYLYASVPAEGSVNKEANRRWGITRRPRRLRPRIDDIDGSSGGGTVPTSIPRTARHSTDAADSLEANVLFRGLCGHYGQQGQITQIYEGTNQIQRVVIARGLLR